jgi:hypothetical protein
MYGEQYSVKYMVNAPPNVRVVPKAVIPINPSIAEGTPQHNAPVPTPPTPALIQTQQGIAITVAVQVDNIPIQLPMDKKKSPMAVPFTVIPKAEQSTNPKNPSSPKPATLVYRVQDAPIENIVAIVPVPKAHNFVGNPQKNTRGEIGHPTIQKGRKRVPIAISIGIAEHNGAIQHQEKPNIGAQTTAGQLQDKTPSTESAEKGVKHGHIKKPSVEHANPQQKPSRAQNTAVRQRPPIPQKSITPPPRPTLRLVISNPAIGISSPKNNQPTAIISKIATNGAPIPELAIAPSITKNSGMFVPNDDIVIPKPRHHVPNQATAPPSTRTARDANPRRIPKPPIISATIVLKKAIILNILHHLWCIFCHC